MTIELKGVAPDRIERQRAFIRDALPLPGTPDLRSLDERLKAKGLQEGAEIFLRAFKSDSIVELWMRKGERFVLFATYPVCHWDGGLGPKIKEGDRQTPEGVYTVSERQFQPSARWPRRFNLGFPNVYDRVHGRTGSYLLVHGGCSSVGCFAMTDEVMKEIHRLAKAAFRAGQKQFQFHIFPFRMTMENIAKAGRPEFVPFWQNLKHVHDVFERSKRPPQMRVCRKRYVAHESFVGEGLNRRLTNGCRRTWGAGVAVSHADEKASVNMSVVRRRVAFARRQNAVTRREERSEFQRRYAAFVREQQAEAQAEQEARRVREENARRLSQRMVLLSTVDLSRGPLGGASPEREPVKSENGEASQFVTPELPARTLIPEEAEVVDTVDTVAPQEGVAASGSTSRNVSPSSGHDPRTLPDPDASGRIVYNCDYSRASCRRYVDGMEKWRRARERARTLTRQRQIERRELRRAERQRHRSRSQQRRLRKQRRSDVGVTITYGTTTEVVVSQESGLIEESPRILFVDGQSVE